MTPKLETIAEMWTTYRSRVLPEKAPPIQVQECRRAFYAGVASMFTNAAYHVADPSISEEEGMEYFSRIEIELAAYAAIVGSKGEMH